MLLVDCGRRMRADDARRRIGTAHFDQVLNAVMLLSYVALKQGDAVGALTFGTPPARSASFAPRKGAHALNALMGELYAVQPTPTHSDYVSAAQDLLRRQRKRCAGHRHHQLPRRGSAASCGRRCGCCARATWCCSPACASASSAS